jgi:hypothetical protein
MKTVENGNSVTDNSAQTCSVSQLKMTFANVFRQSATMWSVWSAGRSQRD